MNHAPPSPDMPFVTLVGAGPGDPELLTLKAAKALAQASVVLVDDLVNDAVLAHVSPNARIVHVGKRGGCQSTPQAFIHKLMVQAVREGEQVVRLKGGDPFIFGRGGEEVEHLRAEGIEVEVVNGITAGLAGATRCGIALTHRGVARGVTLVTAYDRSELILQSIDNIGTLEEIVRTRSPSRRFDARKVPRRHQHQIGLELNQRFQRRVVHAAQTGQASHLQRMVRMAIDPHQPIASTQGTHHLGDGR